MKKGFTLAEVLITLGIIGVVAALTAPALTKNTGRAKIGPALAKYANTFESGCERMFHEEEMGSIEKEDGTQGVIPVENLTKYIIMTPMSSEHTFTSGDGSKQYSFSSHSGTSTGAGGIQLTNKYTDIPFQLKDGSIVNFVSCYNSPELENKGPYKKLVGVTLIDINGKAGPNKAGSDVFAFIIEKSGILIPVGSNAHRFIGEDPPIAYAGYTNHTARCNPKSSVVAENFACTGAVADNAWKADY